MTPIKRPLAAAGAAVLLALALTACGGSPTNASEKDYCEAVNGINDNEDLIKAVTDEDWDKAADLLKDSAEEIEEVGTPEDIPDDAREGFELQLDASADISGDDLEKAFKDQEDPFEADLSGDEKKKVEAYNDYENETCSDTEENSDSGSDEGSDPGVGSSTDAPTDGVSTDVPSGVPTDISPEDLASLQEELEKLTESAPAE